MPATVPDGLWSSTRNPTRTRNRSRAIMSNRLIDKVEAIALTVSLIGGALIIIFYLH
jgi:hypothetical protein